MQSRTRPLARDLTARGVSSEFPARLRVRRSCRFCEESSMRLGHGASARPMAFRAACKQPKQEQKEHSAQVVPLPRSARAQQAAEDQTQIEPCNVDQLTLEDVDRSEERR